MDKAASEKNSVIQPSAQTQKFKLLSRLKFLICFSILAIFIGLGWHLVFELAYVERRLTEIETRLTSATESNRSFGALTSMLDDKILKHRENFENIDAELTRLHSRVDLNVENLAQLGMASSHDQLLMEASNLLSFAEQQAQINHNPDLTLAILKRIDEIFAGLASDRFMLIRLALERDMTALTRKENIDVKRIYSQLANVAEDIAKLESVPARDLLSSDDFGTNETLSEPKVLDKNSDARDVWGQITQKFSDLVIISHRETGLEPLLSREQFIASRQTLMSLVRHAQAALLFGEQYIFSSSLIEAGTYLGRHFKPNKEALELIDVLRHLSNENITREPVNIDDSIAAVERAIKLLRQRSDLKEPTE